jgi:hypothetical protein
MSSARFQSLEEQVKQLRLHLLPEQFDPTGSYPDAAGVGTRALSFRVMAHAEIEAYLEDRVVDVAKTAWKLWQASGKVSRPAFCLLAFSGHTMAEPPETLEAPDEQKRKKWERLLDIKHKLNDAVSDFTNKVLNRNHGVREKDILAVLMPIGFEYQKIDPVLLADLDAFGRARGDAAHRSAIQVQRGIDPQDELKRVEGIVSRLVNIDKEIDEIMSEFGV